MLVESFAMKKLEIQTVGNYAHHDIIQVNEGEFTDIVDQRLGCFPADDEAGPLNERGIAHMRVHRPRHMPHQPREDQSRVPSGHFSDDIRLMVVGLLKK